MPSARHAEVAIYDICGRKVAGLLDESVGPGWGQVTWDGKCTSGRPISSGVYFCVLRAGRTLRTTRLVKLK